MGIRETIHTPLARRHSTPARASAKMARHGIIRHQGRRLRASARAQRLFAARGGADDRDAGEARQGRLHAGPRHHRHQQPVRRAGILGEARQDRHSADHRRAGDGRFRRRSGRLVAAFRAAHGARADRAPRPERSRLPPSDAARLQPLARSEGGRGAACSVRRAPRLRGSHRADRRPRRADRPGARPSDARYRRDAGSAASPRRSTGASTSRSSATGSNWRRRSSRR